MIRSVLRVSTLSLLRDRVALAMTFLLPLVFFSIFATVFGSMDEAGAGPVRAALVLEDEGEFGARFAELLSAQEQLVIEERPADVASARELVRRGKVTVAIRIPEGFSASFQEAEEAGVALGLLADTSNPVGVQVTRGLLQGAAVRLGFELLTELEPGEAGAPSDPLSIELDDVLGRAGKRPSIAFFAAGIGVMFLLFSLTGRAGLLIEEREAGVLIRMLASQLGLARLLFGRWLFLTLLGFLQVSLMFTWGALVFGLELFTPRHLLGFVIMSTVTAASAAAFGLALAAACRTRAQLTGVSAVIVLVMSALGGSMFPRFLMPESMQALGLLTFNAWALDGFQAVFWYEASPLELWPQALVLGGLTPAFLLAAHGLARLGSRAMMGLLLVLLLADPDPSFLVRVTGLAPGEGNLQLALYDSKAAWDGAAEPLRIATLPAETEACEWRLGDLPAGRYAVKAYQDLDGDGQFSRSELGRPREPHGFSGGRKALFGPPKWKKASVQLGAGLDVIEVALRRGGKAPTAEPAVEGETSGPR